MLRSANGKDQAFGVTAGRLEADIQCPLVGMYEPVQICVGLALAPCESVLHGAQVQRERSEDRSRDTRKQWATPWVLSPSLAADAGAFGEGGDERDAVSGRSYF